MRTGLCSLLTQEIQATSKSLSRSFWRSLPPKVELSHILNRQSSFTDQSAKQETLKSNQPTLTLICSIPCQMTYSTPGHSAKSSNLNKPNDRRSAVRKVKHSKHFHQLRILQIKQETSTSFFLVTGKTLGRCSLTATLVANSLTRLSRTR